MAHVGVVVMVTLVIGHRGSGKTSFLRGLRVKTIDLDQELEKRSGVPVAELFTRGESAFRVLEKDTLEDLVASAMEPTVIAVGAGFEGPPPAGAHVLWLRRLTDSAGRSFLNRPRLNAELSPFDEYMERFPVRDRRFRDWAHEELILPEGCQEAPVGFFPTQEAAEKPTGTSLCDLTLLPENFREWEGWIRKRLAWRIRRFEIRDDILDSGQTRFAVASIPADRLVWARREKVMDAPPSVSWDWAMELGAPPDKVFCISLHNRDEGFEAALQRLNVFSEQAEVLKLAVEVKDFVELKRGHDWWSEDPEHRAFLPNSPDGRWRWYRSLFGPRMPVHFIREGDGSSPDQPILWQALMQPSLSARFAAVLGHPVGHSRTPGEHQGFFKERGLPVVAIDVPEEEFSFALEFLTKLGLSHAAVTSPLKKQAWAQAHHVSNEARRTQSANTLYIRSGRRFAHNTDVLALERLKSKLSGLESVWLWGGGGVKTSVKAIWPHVKEVPARQGFAGGGADMVIWATGRSRNFVWPSSQLRPKLVLDLNYGEDSPGLEWAVREKLVYESGLEMFKSQAEFQREFWGACEQHVR